jgi:GntR family histidine utilization transcriptional repressor
MAELPLYRMVKDHILERIEDGRLAKGARAPSEAEIVELLGVSRMTANRALNELASEGLLIRIAGSGTFVADRRARGELLALKDIAVELAERGHKHAVDVLVHEPVRASREMADLFETKAGARLVHAKLVHRRDGDPVLLEDRYVSAAVAPGYADIDLATTTSFEYLTRTAVLQKVEHVIRALAATAETARLLTLKAGAPCLVVRRRTWSKGRVASVATLAYAGDRYEISGEFGAGAGKKRIGR